MDMVRVSLAFIDGLGASEMVLIFVVVLVLFGGEKLPGFARGLGKSIREFKKAAAGVEEEFKRALEEDERKNTTPALPPPAATEPLPDQGGPAASEHANVHDDGYSEHPPYEDYTTQEPDHAQQPVEPKIQPPTPPEPPTPPPASTEPAKTENPSPAATGSGSTAST